MLCSRGCFWFLTEGNKSYTELRRGFTEVHRDILRGPSCLLRGPSCNNLAALDTIINPLRGKGFPGADVSTILDPLRGIVV
jgi:hypothetical protein